MSKIKTSHRMVIPFLILMTIPFNSHSYVEEKIQFTAEDGVVLAGYFTKPAGQAAGPALVIQMGSGKGSTDNEARPYNPFAEIARKISDNGFAVLRFDKRGTGYNAKNGSFEDSAFNDYVSDFKAAVRYTQGRKDVSGKQLFYMSHSLGGPVIMTAAADVAPTGIILSASPGRLFSEYNVEQLGNWYEFGEGIKGPALRKKMDDERKFNALLGDPKEACRQYPDRCVAEGGKTHIDGQSLEFWRQVSKVDPIALVKRLHCPVLVVNGTSDWVVSSDHDANAIFSSLNPDKNNRLRILKKLDHFLSSSPSKKASVEYLVKAAQGKPIALKIHPGLTDELNGWLSLFQKNKP